MLGQGGKKSLRKVLALSASLKDSVIALPSVPLVSSMGM